MKSVRLMTREARNPQGRWFYSSVQFQKVPEALLPVSKSYLRAKIVAARGRRELCPSCDEWLRAKCQFTHETCACVQIHIHSVMQTEKPSTKRDEREMILSKPDRTYRDPRRIQGDSANSTCVESLPASPMQRLRFQCIKSIWNPIADKAMHCKLLPPFRPCTPRHYRSALVIVLYVQWSAFWYRIKVRFNL
jgi:hypothetical protein